MKLHTLNILSFLLIASLSTAQEAKERAEYFLLNGQVEKIKFAKSQLVLETCGDREVSLNDGELKQEKTFFFNEKNKLIAKQEIKRTKKDSVIIEYISEKEYWENGFLKTSNSIYKVPGEETEFTEIKYDTLGNELFNKFVDGETVSERIYEYSKEGQLKNMVKKDGKGKVWRWLEVKMDELGRVIEQYYFKKYGSGEKLLEINYLEYDSLNRLIKKRIVNKQFKVEDEYRIYNYFANGDIEISNVSLSNGDSVVKRILRLNEKMETIAQLGRNGDGFDGGYNYLNEMGQVVKSKSTIGNRTSITEYDENGDRVSFKLFEDGKELDASHLGEVYIQYFHDKKNNWIKKIEYGNLQCFCTEREITYRD